MAEEELELAEESSGGSKKKLLIIIGIAVLVLLVGGGTALFFLLEGEEKMAEEGLEQSQEEVKKPAIYVAMEPAFTINLQGSSKAKYLQLALQILVRDPQLEDAINQHSPALRNQLVLMLSSKTSQELATLEGKTKLQKEALKTVQNVLKDAAGLEGVEAVLFTSFVMQ